MAATVRMKVYTGTTAGTENPDAAPGTNAANFNFLSADSYDSAGTAYLTNPVVVPSSGTNYSYERWVRFHFSGTFTSIDNILFYKSSGILSDSAIVINAGRTETAATPVNTASAVATSAVPTTSAAALNITPSAGALAAAGYSRYVVLQLKIPSTVVTPNDIGIQTYTCTYDET